MRHSFWTMVMAVMLPCVAAVAGGPGISVTPVYVGPPVRVQYGTEKLVTITVTNTGDATLNITSIQGIKAVLPTKDWLGVSTSVLTVPSGASNTATFDIILNKGGVITYTPGTLYTLSGLVYIKSDAAAPNDSINIVLDKIEVVDAGGTPSPSMWDTMATGCTRLIVSDRGEIGRLGEGGVNMDYRELGGDCDTSARVYLYDGGPIVVRRNGSNYVLSSALYQADQNTDQAFVPLASGPPAGRVSGPGYTGFYTGTLVNRDTSVAVARTYYAPSVTDSCNFIIQKTVFRCLKGFCDQFSLGEIIDWDIPSYAGSSNDGHILSSKHTVYQQGLDTSSTGCQKNSNRFGSVAFLGMYRQYEYFINPCINNTNFYGAYVMNNDTLYKYASDTVSNSARGAYFWSQMGGLSGLSGPPVQGTDQHMVMTYTYGKWFDTLIVYTALASVANGDTATLRIGIDKARQWYIKHLRTECTGAICLGNCCCYNNPSGLTGNIDCDPGGGKDISDLSALVDYLFISFNPLCCLGAADIDGDGRVDISDLSRIIDCFFIFPEFCDYAPCH